MAGICVLCSAELDPSDTTFEQRLVGDDSFCAKCWKDIMAYDGDYVVQLG